MKIKKIVSMLLLSTCVGIVGCDAYLDAKPNLNLEIPESLENLKAILDAESIINISMAMDMMASDEYYLLPNVYESLNSLMYQQIHIWDMDKSMYPGEAVLDWNRPYEIIFAANYCLEQLQNIERVAGNTSEWDNLKGRALFIRAHAYSELIKLFAPQYEVSTAGEVVAIPMPLEANVNLIHGLESLETVYDQIFLDLDVAIGLLPDLPKYRSQPSKASVYGLLARVYLTMKNYPKALEAAENALDIQSSLLDFSLLNPNLNYPVPRGNEEVIYHTLGPTYDGMTSSAETRVDTMLYQLYHKDDLRKNIYFFQRPQGQINFKGSFSAGHQYFTGITVGEMLLVVAECSFREGDTLKANQALNLLLESRFRKGTFTPIDLNDSPQALQVILDERRKELVFRGRRWSDIKRLIGDPGFSGQIVRIIGEKHFTLPSDPKSLVFPIPPNEFANR